MNLPIGTLLSLDGARQVDAFSIKNPQYSQIEGRDELFEQFPDLSLFPASLDVSDDHGD